MRKQSLEWLVFCAAIIATSCGTYSRRGLEAVRAQEIEKKQFGRVAPLAPDLEKRVLALDAENVSAQEVRDVLSHTPAPRIINIHGGISWVIPRMISFSEFLIGMGYPASSITNPGDGTYTFSCYESSEKIAGVIAWYYEKEALRPIMVGHSQGGMQVVKVLYRFAEDPSSELHVWNPLTWEREERCEITDPLTGTKRPVAGLRMAYATAVGAGGLTRVLPNQWDMTLRLHTIPDSVEEFTGFCKGWDPVGGDYLGYGSANHYKASGRTIVRSVWLPSDYAHGQIPDVKHLLVAPKIVDWINQYRPSKEVVSRPTVEAHFDADSSGIIWAAEVWYHIKKHWVLELQRRIRAQRHGGGA